jgi:hypothetical protein
VNLLRVPHWVMVIGASLLIGPFFVSQRWMMEQGWLETMPVGDVPPWAAAAVGLTLTILAVLGAWWHFKWKPMRAAILLSLWSAVMLTFAWYAWSTGERSIHPVRAPAEKFAEVVDGGVVGYFKHREHPLSPNEEFLLYSRRIIPPVRPTQAEAFGRSAARVYVLAPRVADARRVLRRSGYERLRVFQHDYDERLELWRYVGGTDLPAAGQPGQSGR